MARQWSARTHRMLGVVSGVAGVHEDEDDGTILVTGPGIEGRCQVEFANKEAFLKFALMVGNTAMLLLMRDELRKEES